MVCVGHRNLWHGDLHDRIIVVNAAGTMQEGPADVVRAVKDLMMDAQEAFDSADW